MRRVVIAFALALLSISTSVLARTAGDRVPAQNLPIVGGAYDPAQVGSVETREPLNSSLDELYDVGTTWYDYQHNGTAGKMVGTDALGFVHLVWMKGMDSGQVSRHIFYNVYDPGSDAMLFGASGQQVDNAARGGYTTVVVSSDGFAYPTFHQVIGAGVPHTASAIDFLPASGAFTSISPSFLNVDGDELQLIWPKVDMGIDGRLHVVSTESPTIVDPGIPQRIYYSRGTPVIEDGFGTNIVWDQLDGNEEFLLVDTAMVIAPDIACARHSNRVAIAWSKSRDDLNDAATRTQYNNDLYLQISEDGGTTWDPEINITNFEYPDLNCASGDTSVCDRDTFRVYTCMSLLFDDNDNVHVAFTTSYLWELEGLISPSYSDIWHWDEVNQIYSNLAHGSFNAETIQWPGAPGAWQRMVHRPNLAIDTTTGFLYCSFQRYDTLQWSESGYPQGEAYVTVSTNHGYSWAEATNVSNTDGGQNAPAGSCLSERDITMSKYVTYSDGEGYLNMEWVLDLDAGGVPQNEGVAVDCPVKYNRLPLSEVLMDPMHDPGYPALRVDSTGYPFEEPNSVGNENNLLPTQFTLHQNYPNPFNPSTKIQYDLGRAGRVTISIFNVLGQEAARLIDNEAMTAGAHVTEFDASSLTSGVYIYRLSVDGVSATRKMVLMK